MKDPVVSATQALEAMLALYGPPLNVAHLCEYPDHHPITLARKALADLRAQADRLPDTVSDRTIAEIVTLAEAEMSAPRGMSRNVIDVPPAYRKHLIEKASAVVRAAQGAGDQTERVAEAIWRSGLPEDRMREAWQDLNPASRQIYRDSAVRSMGLLAKIREGASDPSPVPAPMAEEIDIPADVIGMQLCKMVGDQLRISEEVYFEKGNAAVRTTLRRAAISGKVGPIGKTGQFWADLLTRNGMAETIALDQDAWNGLKNRWMRCRMIEEE